MSLLPNLRSTAAILAPCLLVLSLTVVGTAAAREGPRAAAPRPDTGCEAFGPDFRKIEGTDSCIRISGSVHVEGTYATGGGAPASSSLFRR